MFGTPNDVVLYGDDKKCFFCDNETKETNYFKHSFNFDGRDLIILINSHSNCLKYDDAHLHTLNAYLASNQSCIICDKKEQEKQYITFIFPNDRFGMYIGRECGCKSLFYHYMKKIESDIFNKLNAANTLLGKTEDLLFQCGDIERFGIHKATLLSRADFQKYTEKEEERPSKDKEEGPTIFNPSTFTSHKVVTENNEYYLNKEKQIQDAMLELSRPYFRKF